MLRALGDLVFQLMIFLRELTQQINSRQLAFFYASPRPRKHAVLQRNKIQESGNLPAPESLFGVCRPANSGQQQLKGERQIDQERQAMNERFALPAQHLQYDGGRNDCKERKARNQEGSEDGRNAEQHAQQREARRQRRPDDQTLMQPD